MDLKQHAVSGATWGLVQNAGNQLLSLAVFLVLARMLAPVEFGLFALAYAWISLATIVINSGFEAALVQRPELEDAHVHTVFWFNLLLSLLMVLITMVASPWLANLFSAPDLANLIVVFAPIFLLNSPLLVQRALLRRRFEFKVLATRLLVASLIGNLVALRLATTGFGVWSLVVRELVNAIMAVLLLWSATKWRPRWVFSWHHFKQLYGFGSKMMANNIMHYLFRRSDNLLIGYFLGPTLLGFYSVAYRILELMIQITTRTLVSVSTPLLARLQDDPQRFANAASKLNIAITMFSVPLFIGLGVLAPEIVPLVFGEQWQPSIQIMQLLALIGIAHSQSHLLGSAMVALGRPGLQLQLRMVEGVVSILIVLAVIKHGIAAAAMVYSLVAMAMVPAWFWFLARLLRPATMTNMSSIVRIALAGGLMLVLVLLGQHYWVLEWPSWLRLITLIALGVIGYGVMLVLLLPSSVELVRSITTLSLRKR